jgi:protein-disulfide isomerase
MEEAERTEREKVRDIVREYILNNPEVIIESMEQLQKRKIQEIENAATGYIERKKSEIENKVAFPVLGNKDGDIAIVAFYDYNCGYCKKGEEQITKLLEDDRNIAVILRPFPVIGESSLYAARVALVIYKNFPDKFLVIHDAFLRSKMLDFEFVNRTLSENGIDLSLIESEINKAEIGEMMDSTFEIAANLKIQGVPAYIINGRLLPGFVEKDRIAGLIKEIRAESGKSQDVLKNE